MAARRDRSVYRAFVRRLFGCGANSGSISPPTAGTPSPPGSPSPTPPPLPAKKSAAKNGSGPRYETLPKEPAQLRPEVVLRPEVPPKTSTPVNRVSSRPGRARRREPHGGSVPSGRRVSRESNGLPSIVSSRPDLYYESVLRNSLSPTVDESHLLRRAPPLGQSRESLDGLLGRSTMDPASTHLATSSFAPPAASLPHEYGTLSPPRRPSAPPSLWSDSPYGTMPRQQHKRRATVEAPTLVVASVFDPRGRSQLRDVRATQLASSPNSSADTIPRRYRRRASAAPIVVPSEPPPEPPPKRKLWPGVSKRRKSSPSLGKARKVGLVLICQPIEFFRSRPIKPRALLARSLADRAA